MSYQSELYHQRKSEGICTDCGKVPPKPGYVRCHPCLTKRTDRSHDLEAKGICPHCRKQPVADGSKRCRKCLDKSAKQAQDRRQHRRDAGLCIMCGKGAVKPPYTICAPCRKQNRNRECRLGPGIRDTVLGRDNRQCRLCGKARNDRDLMIHHIDHSGQTDDPNHDMGNLVTLCRSCHFHLHRLVLNLTDVPLCINLIRQEGRR